MVVVVVFVQVVEVIRNPDRPGDGEEETDQTVSKEEEERYRKLQQENEQLQQLIASREQKLKLLNQRLLERNASANVNGVAANPTSSTATSTNNTMTTPVISGVTRTTTIHLPPVKKNRYKLWSLSSHIGSAPLKLVPSSYL